MVVSAFTQRYLPGIAHLSAITVLINASFLESNSYPKLPTVFDGAEGIEPPDGFSLFSQASSYTASPVPHHCVPPTGIEPISKV